MTDLLTQCHPKPDLPLEAWARHAAAANGFGGIAMPETRSTRSTRMQLQPHVEHSKRYAKCVEVSKRIRWDIDRDVFRSREFAFDQKFLPDGLTLVSELAFLSEAERRLLSQVQGRTYAYLFGLCERFIGAKMLEVSHGHRLGDQVALEALVRFTDEELKHQEMFRRIEQMIAAAMPPGYQMTADPNAIASFVLGKSTWAVLALTCHIELFTQAHYRSSIEPDAGLSPLYKDIFLFHWKEESQHAILDELEWKRENERLTPEQRDSAVDDLIALVAGIDGTLQAQAAADVHYFVELVGRALSVVEVATIKAQMLRAYRWQYIVSGVQEPRFIELLTGMITPAQSERIGAALAPIVAAGAPA